MLQARRAQLTRMKGQLCSVQIFPVNSCRPSKTIGVMTMTEVTQGRASTATTTARSRRRLQVEMEVVMAEVKKEVSGMSRRQRRARSRASRHTTPHTLTKLRAKKWRSWRTRSR